MKATIYVKSTKITWSGSGSHKVREQGAPFPGNNEQNWGNNAKWKKKKVLGKFQAIPSQQMTFLGEGL